MSVKKSSLIFSFALFWVLLLSQTASADFGVSPPSIQNEHLLPGSYFEREIFLVRSQAAEAVPMVVIFSQELEEIRNWFEVEPGLEFVIPAGVQQFPLKVKTQVPQDAQLGKYSGYIWIEGKPAKDQKEQVRTMVGGTISVNLTVTDKKYSDWQLRDLRIEHLAEGEKALKVFLKVENLGNIRARPSKVELEVYDSFHQDLLFSGENSELEWVEPFETREIAAEFSVDLEPHRQYWAEIEIYKEDELLLADKRRLNVGEILTREKPGLVEAEPIEVKKEPPEERAERGVFQARLSWIILAALLVLAATAVFAVREIRKRRKEEESAQKNTRPKKRARIRK